MGITTGMPGGTMVILHTLDIIHRLQDITRHLSVSALATPTMVPLSTTVLIPTVVSQSVIRTARSPHTAGGAALSHNKQSKWTPGQARGDNTLVIPGLTRNPFLFDKSLSGLT